MKTAKEFNVHYQSVFKWVRLYKKEGKKGLLYPYKRPWNRTKKEIEERIVLMKEENPTLTIRKTKKILENEGIKMSIKGIWGIWKRYGYAGFKKEKMSNDFSDYVPWSKEARKKFEQARELFNIGKDKEAAGIINSIPFLPHNKLLTQFHNSYLNLRRQIEVLSNLFGKIPVSSYLKRTEFLYIKLKKEKLNYSALRVGIMEAIALGWSVKVKKQLEMVKDLEKIIKRRGNYYTYLLFGVRFNLLALKGTAYSLLSKMKKAETIARICHLYLMKRKYVSSYFLSYLATIYMNIEDCRKAEYWLLKAKNRADEELNRKIKGKLAQVFLLEGDYRKAMDYVRYLESGGWVPHSWKLLFQSTHFMMKGKPHKAIKLSLNALSLSRKEELTPNIFSTFFIIASLYCSIGEKVKAKKTLSRALAFFKKNKLERFINILEILLFPNSKSKTYTHTEVHELNFKQSILQIENLLPSAKLALFLKNGEYSRALSYANKKGILTYFYRYIFFFPQVVKQLLEKGKQTGLPKPIIKLPVFNKEIPVYNIKFLGDLIVYKNQRYQKVKLWPKDISFLIYLALRAGEPNKRISLEKIYKNFWKNSKNPKRNLSHLLVRVKKALNIPSHLLQISYRKDYPFLINNGMHFITDYGEYQELIEKGKAFLRAGEWGFARKEFARAFKLFRGEPFKKMYDNWSDDKRLEILFSYETGIRSFTKELIKKGKKEAAEKLLKKAKTILPDLDEIPDLVI